MKSGQFQSPRIVGKNAHAYVLLYTSHVYGKII